MDTRQIEYILQIAEENNITKAAEKLFITPVCLKPAAVKAGTGAWHASVSAHQKQVVPDRCRAHLCGGRQKNDADQKRYL